MNLTAFLRTVSALPRSIRPLQHRSFQPDFVPRDPKTEPKKYRYPAYYDPYGPAPPPSDKILWLADRIKALLDEERKQLFAALRARLELPEAVTFKGSGAAAGAEAESDAQKGEEMEEKTAYDVKLERFDGAAKLKVVKEVREFTKLGLKESKELVEKAPAVLKKGVSKEEAEVIIDRIKAAGGVAVME